jgi:hypothetical protein
MRHVDDATHDSIDEKVARADLVILGQLFSHTERAILDTEIRYESDSENGLSYTHYRYYDLVRITVLKELKGKAVGDEITVKFLSYDQTQPSQRKVDVMQFSIYDINEPGIWILDIRDDEEPGIYAERGSFYPVDFIDEVTAAVDADGS